MEWNGRWKEEAHSTWINAGSAWYWSKEVWREGQQGGICVKDREEGGKLLEGRVEGQEKGCMKKGGRKRGRKEIKGLCVLK
jgi:hypothetical protein